MTTYPPPETDGRILPFRQRGGLVVRHPPAASGPARDLAGYQRLDDDGPEEFRHRMKMNGLAALVLVLLIAIGLWITDTMVTIRDGQNCVLSGRSNCQAIVVTPPVWN